MYRLTLTHNERKAFDWVGDRYFAGEMARLLRMECRPEPEFAEWGDDGEITFLVPESTFWFMREQAWLEECQWPCFAPELDDKLNDFLNQLV